MSTLARTSPFSTTIGRKFIVSLTGLFLVSFLIVHLSGNLLLLKGDNGEAFNEYAHFMGTNPIIRTMEIVLFGGIILHIFTALKHTLHNRRSRPVGYKVNKKSPQTTNYGRFMAISGTIVLIFLILHLVNFWIPHRFGVMGEVASLYQRVVNLFEQPGYVAFYVLSMGLVGYHLAHGFQSAFQTLGLQVNKSLGGVIQGIGYLFAVILPIGFALIPLLMFFDLP